MWYSAVVTHSSHSLQHTQFADTEQLIHSLALTRLQHTHTVTWLPGQDEGAGDYHCSMKEEAMSSQDTAEQRVRLLTSILSVLDSEEREMDTVHHYGERG